jgi:hypothetical protein
MHILVLVYGRPLIVALVSKEVLAAVGEELQKPAFWKSMKKQEKIVSLHHIELWYCK